MVSVSLHYRSRRTRRGDAGDSFPTLYAFDVDAELDAGGGAAVPPLPITGTEEDGCTAVGEHQPVSVRESVIVVS